jgi:putative sugar O-methyltransferase
MIDAYVESPAFKAVSKYWSWLNIKNIQQLSDCGYSNFKQTVARNYFTWVEALGGSYLNDVYLRNLLTDLDRLALQVPLKQIMKKHDQFTLMESVQYNLATALLFEYVNCRMGSTKCEIIDEPLEGNPPYITLNNRRVTQDILNSTLEYLSLVDVCKFNNVSRILELGAGSGRTSFCLMKHMPEAKYVVVDIPPALFISQTYLSTVFPKRQIFKFRPFKSFDEVEEEFQMADLAFLMPHQIDLLSPKSIDLFLAIDCLHEMTREQTEIYFRQADRLARLFYYKCWNETTVRFDNIVYTNKDYPVRATWTEVFNRPCEVPSAYFEACYSTG